MNSSKADESGAAGWGLEELKLLAAMGFGPDSALMNEPKMLVDGTFLGALQSELVSELGEVEAMRMLFHIGMIHGLRDAARIAGAEPLRDGQLGLAAMPPLAMRFGPGHEEGQDPLGFELEGTWPDGLEAESHLSQLGPRDLPVCSLSAGYTSGWLSGTLERDVIVHETSCHAAGADACRFVARDEAREEDSDAPMRGTLPVSAVRSVAHIAGSTPFGTRIDQLPSRVDLEDPAVHIWGPVMVMPFAGPEPAMQTVEMLRQDDASHGVRVVVLDLGGCVLDDGLGAAALERVVGEIQSWNAEVILTGVSPLSEETVAELQASHMLTRKDMAEAVAYAFQIADAQRRLL